MAALFLAAATLTGCVSQGDYDDMQKLYRARENEVTELQARIAELNNRILALQNSTRQDPELLARLEQALAERKQLADALAAAQAELGKQPTRIVINALEPELDRALQEFAAANPDLITYDPALGMVKFRSDLTFALGSTEINQAAARPLAALADILKRPVAQGYEVRVVGHTDNVRISRPETLAKHPTNFHLSAHRAIAVKDELAKAGISPVRIAVVGHGEFRPVAPNGTRGAEANRRVEIFLVPMTYRGAVEAAPATEGAGAAPAGGATTGSGTTERPAGPPDVNK
jgi:chemotaxis protein MotB